MQKLISLCGKDNTGKTETLKWLISLLEKQKGIDVITHSPRDYAIRKAPSHGSDVWASLNLTLKMENIKN